MVKTERIETAQFSAYAQHAPAELQRIMTAHRAEVRELVTGSVAAVVDQAAQLRDDFERNERIARRKATRGV